MKTKRAPAPRVGTGQYLLRVDGTGFFVRLSDDKRPLLSPYPSRAFHGDYDLLDQLCRQLIAQGYHECVVTSLYGEPINAAALITERTLEQARIAEWWKNYL